MICHFNLSTKHIFIMRNGNLLQMISNFGYASLSWLMPVCDHKHTQTEFFQWNCTKRYLLRLYVVSNKHQYFFLSFCLLFYFLPFCPFCSIMAKLFNLRVSLRIGSFNYGKYSASFRFLSFLLCISACFMFSLFIFCSPHCYSCYWYWWYFWNDLGLNDVQTLNINIITRNF